MEDAKKLEAFQAKIDAILKLSLKIGCLKIQTNLIRQISQHAHSK